MLRRWVPSFLPPAPYIPDMLKVDEGGAMLVVDGSSGNSLST